LNTDGDANRMIYDAQETDLDSQGHQQLALSQNASMLQWTTSHLTAYGAILASRWREFCV
jgi:hypothetical protein